MPSQPTVRERPCPTCQKTVRWTPDAAYRPFCSKRCRLIDLGEWASESFRIPDRQSATDLDGQLPPTAADEPQQ